MITFVDPGAATTNLGDLVISQSVRENLIDPIKQTGEEVVTVPLHGELSREHRLAIRSASEVLVCGTNLLSDHAYFRSPWHWKRDDIGLARGKLTMFGVGWWQYQRAGIDVVSAHWMRSLQARRPWAVRDEYSALRLRRGGIDAVHLSCPTLWGVDLQRLPSPGGAVVVTLTDYNQDPLADERLIALLEAQYDQISFWPQGPGDAAYLRSLRPGADILEPTLAAFDEALLEHDRTRYVGLRLHAGVRAMQLGRPSLPLSIDNRAREISRSVGLVAPSRHDLKAVEAAILHQSDKQLSLPTAAIKKWRELWLT